MSRFTLRRGRILPGPLKALPLEDRRGGGVLAAPLALTAAAVAASLLVMPHVSNPFAPGPAAGPTAATEPSDPSRPALAAKPAPPAAVPVMEAPTAAPTAEPAPRAAAPAPDPARAPTSVASAAAPGRPAQGASPFNLDGMPVLQGDLAGLDVGGSADVLPARTAAKPARRAANRAAAPVAAAQP